MEAPNIEHTPVAVKASSPNCLESFGVLFKFINDNRYL